MKMFYIHHSCFTRFSLVYSTRTRQQIKRGTGAVKYTITMKKILVIVFMLQLTASVQAQSFSPEVKAFVTIPAGTIAITDVKIIDGTGGRQKITRRCCWKMTGLLPWAIAKKSACRPTLLLLTVRAKRLSPDW